MSTHGTQAKWRPVLPERRGLGLSTSKERRPVHLHWVHQQEMKAARTAPFQRGAGALVGGSEPAGHMSRPPPPRAGEAETDPLLQQSSADLGSPRAVRSQAPRQNASWADTWCLWPRFKRNMMEKSCRLRPSLGTCPKGCRTLFLS